MGICWAQSKNFMKAKIVIEACSFHNVKAILRRKTIFLTRYEAIFLDTREQFKVSDVLPYTIINLLCV